ncbi:MAG: hypothetical protein COW02_01625 [Comamonadaceae bacterium CG12_big_fil_rev_8_21_14_0_65_59_15]|nr:MAG: hypothetical protein COW02_01625 [Comamonadaceae bacterium CG12_big_fil_rev_8_21_14_0_65_59_15]PIY00820.1 MAG: hypothetical protein COZ23_06405 [Hydrogenophilales bacterium CG_4_10_14_3_um_filter_58_23]
MNNLAQLQFSLTRIFRKELAAASRWENSDAIKRLKKINHEMDGMSTVPASNSLTQVVAAYRRTRNVNNFRDLKYVCYGAALQLPEDGWCVLGNEKLRDKLFADIEQLGEPRRRFKCFQALLSSYFSFALYDEHTSEAARNGWEALRFWLAYKRVQFQRDGAKNLLCLPGWFAVLTEHVMLLTSTPCDRYGEELLRGDGTSIENARQGLGIPGDSWVMEEAILSQMKAAIALGDALFKIHLDSLLKLVLGQMEVKVSDLLKRRAIALLISRYARCASKPEQPVLRDAAVSIIGNPWLKRTAWDAWVKNSNDQPDDEARELVNGWLTRQLITDFFELLSADGRADQRRLNYWLRFVPAIEGTPWLALGPDSLRNNTQPYRDLRERANGHLLRLENPGSTSNNAFIMKMGEWLIVEFGMMGNACYVYPATPMPFSLGGVVISLHDLKDKYRGESLRHQDGLSSWESNFDQAICPKVGHWPSSKIPNITKIWKVVQPESNKLNVVMPQSDTALNIEKFAADWKLKIEDNRPAGGALWVCTDDSRAAISYALKNWGFRYKYGKGWWRE